VSPYSVLMDLRRARALWEPVWFALDQPLAVGRRTDHTFFTPTPAAASSRGYALQFYGLTLFLGEFEVRDTAIVAIEHPALGGVREVEIGMSYKVELIDGAKLEIDAEGESRWPPGLAVRMSEGVTAPDSWDLTVTVDVGPPIEVHPWLSRGIRRDLGAERPARTRGSGS
jgi:hypothetical protein